MAKKEYIHSNVEGFSLKDGGTGVEDVTKVGLPTLNFKTNAITGAGMVADIDMPTSQLEAMEFTVTHNNGMGCSRLSTPGTHSLEVRVARQVYSTEKREASHKGVIFRIEGIFAGREEGDIETNSPYGSTDKYKVVRYEKLIDGKTVLLVDIGSGTIYVEGQSYTDGIDALLD